MNAMFFRCSELTSLDLSTFDTSNVTGMNAMFSRCETLTSLDLSTFDTSNVTDMGAMFNKCASLESITFGKKFVTSIVEDMSNMFYSCSDLTSLDLSTFDFSSVTYSSDMLENLGSEENPITIYVKNDDDKKTIENDLLYYDNSYATVLVKGQE